MATAEARGWGPGWRADRGSEQVKVSRGGATPAAAWVHRGIAPLVAEGLRRTEDEAGYDVRMLGGFVNRAIRGSTTKPSNHSWGLAIDINWDRNPMVSGSLVTDLPPQVVAIWKSLGFGWGGDYRTRKDAMHFEFAGTPAQAAALVAQIGVAPVGAVAAPPAADGIPRPLLRRGAKGESVSLCQKLLNGHGASLGVDGHFGNKTLAAVIAFQRGATLLPDGIVGPRTWAALG
jgi:hypothetical protein